MTDQQLKTIEVMWEINKEILKSKSDTSWYDIKWYAEEISKTTTVKVFDFIINLLWTVWWMYLLNKLIEVLWVWLQK